MQTLESRRSTRRSLVRSACVAVLALLACSAVPALDLARQARAGDWPAYRGDLHRSGISAESLAFPLHEAWRHDAPQPPAPAWPEPIRILNRSDFDYAPHPVVAGGLVFIASSSDDALRAFDALTGREAWRFIAGGPIRFAPQVEGGRVYFVADDARVYCLEASTGRLVWSFLAAPADERIIGNGRMISRWPLRSALAVANGEVYTIAGMWPTEGIYVWSLDAVTGKVNWCNDTAGWQQRGAGSKWDAADPHSGEFSFTGLTPQGAMLLDHDVLVVPLGNNAPALLNRRTGALISWTAHSDGGASVTMDGDMYYSMMRGRSADSIWGRRAPSRGQVNRVLRFPESEVPQLSPYADHGPAEVHAAGKVSYLVRDEKLIARQAFGLALAAQTLLVGQDGYIVAEDPATGRELWRAGVDGEARDIAIAQGRLYVGTSRGTLYCFAPGSAAARTATPPPARVAGAPALRAPWVERLEQAGMDQGFALIAGDDDGAMAVTLASQTRLQIVSVVTDAARAQALRERLLATTRLHGRRIHVHQVDALGKLPFAACFANAVVLAARTAPAADAAVSAKELYRVLRPCGGVLLAPNLDGASAAAFLRQAGALPGELQAASPAIVRGPLPGARDWNSAQAPDARVKWPLRPLWFGGPPSSLGMFTHLGQHPPVAANGRYFILGNSTLSAVDAYNGVVLWTRDVPCIYPNYRILDGVEYAIAGGGKIEYPQILSVLRRAVGADADHVYLTLGQAYFQGKGEACIRLDARTGRQEQMYAPFNATAPILLTGRQSWPLAVDERHAGRLTLEPTAEGLCLQLDTTDPAASPLDAWDLFFDFRPPEARYGLFDPGAFQIIVNPAPAPGSAPSWRPGAGPAHPAQLQLTGGRTAQGTQTTVLVPWSQIAALMPSQGSKSPPWAGGMPASFAFAAVLSSHDGAPGEPIAQARLFCDPAGVGLNSGWGAIVLRTPAPAGGSASSAAPPPPAVVAGPLASMPAGWASPGADNPPSIDPALRDSSRIHPLTGEPVPRIYRSGTGGCGRPTFSATGVFGRTSKLAIGLYDFDDDSGLRFFGGIASNCGVNLKARSMNAALGLLISAEARSHCTCLVPFRTSVVFAPAERRLNEDWAIFFDHDADTLIRTAAVNLGAFGDRRDGEGRLWLGFPRPPGAHQTFPLEPASRRMVVSAGPVSGCLQVPFKVELYPRGGVYRFNADHLTIAGTARPWLYASGYRGLLKAELQVNLLRPLAALPAAVPTEPSASAAPEPQIRLSYTRTDVFLRHDAQGLRLIARRPSVVNRAGKTLPWVKTVQGDNGDVWLDDSFEVFLTDASRSHVLHLGLAAAGARFTGLSASPGAAEERLRSAAWTAVATPTDDALTLEFHVPWKTLADAGIDRATLALNCQMNQKDTTTAAPSFPGAESPSETGKGPVTDALASLGPRGRAHCANFAPLGLDTPPAVPQRPYTVRLHFAEPDGLAPGQRVFDVQIQGQTVLKDFDVAREAGGPLTALVREFKHVQVGASLTLEFASELQLPASKRKPQSGSVLGGPILSAIEVFDEGLKP